MLRHPAVLTDTHAAAAQYVWHAQACSAAVLQEQHAAQQGVGEAISSSPVSIQSVHRLSCFQSMLQWQPMGSVASRGQACCKVN
jgi:hypothetical protein